MASSIKKLKMTKFLSMLGDRQARFKSGPLMHVEADSARKLAKALHPARQYLKVAAVIERAPDCKSFTLVPDEERGTTALAFFGAGKYLSVFETIDGMPVSRAYSISSAPRRSLDGEYELTIKRTEGGLVSNYILDNWSVGTKVETSAPAGNFEYQPIRDAADVIALAGGSGITPFVSMANAIADGDEDFNLTILFGSRNSESIIFRDELAGIAEKCSKVKIVHVLSDEASAPEGAETGFITADLIKKYAPAEKEYSLFICGPQAMYKFLENEVAKLELPRKFVRHEMFGEFFGPESEPDYPENVPETVNITVTIQDETRTVSGKSTLSVMRILEEGGIAVPARCRSGECGFCHSHLISGEVYIPKSMDYLREADRKFGCIHPCCSFPLSDLKLSIPAAK